VYFDVLSSRMEDWIVGEINCTLVITTESDKIF
jgi:hypothetical protein